ncbi:MAG TPA: nucleoside hydrolase [Lacipirellulaceae bacterium]|nr:nucleoside hydrolase [Lacipirellulaceae bacterium]HMP04708.1 nucleoside hydrolase [Lacipirellulaceae bacterium]
MARKVILDVDPGVGDALAVSLALATRELDVVAVLATGGNVSPRQASRNVQALVEHLDPPRWPRIGIALEDQPLRTDGRELWGVDGFCGVELGVVELHQQHSSVKVLSEEIRAAPGEITVIAGGPLSNIAALLQLEPDVALMIGHLMIVGGTLDGPGDVTAAAEFNIYCDAISAQRVFRSDITKTLLPRDVTSRAAMTFDLLSRLPDESTGQGRVLRALLPGAFHAYRQRVGLEGMFIPEAVAVAIAMRPQLLTAESWPCDVETEGALTHGATVIDRRRHTLERGTMDVGVKLDVRGVADTVFNGLGCTK